MALNNVGADSGTYVSGLQLRTKYNTDLENLLTAFASGTAPTSPDANMYWLDTSGGTYAVLKKRNPDNDAWIEVFRVHLTEDALYHPGAFKILENSDVCTITHDGDDLFIKTSDGQIVFQTDEGTNTDTELVVKGKGTGEGRIIICGASATNTVTLEAPALTGNHTVTLPDSDVDLADVGSGGGGALANLLPNSAMTFWNQGASTVPMYMTSTMAGVSGSSPGNATSIGWKATVQNTASSDGFLGWDLGSNGFVDGNVFDLAAALNVEHTLIARVKASDASRVKLLIYDDQTGNTLGTAHSGGGSTELLTVTATIDPAATDVKFGLYIISGSQITVEVELFCLVRGSACTHWIPYISRNRKVTVSFTAAASGSASITGCGFTPTSGYCNAGNAGVASLGSGSFSLEGATITQKAVGYGSGSVYDRVYHVNTTAYGVLTSIDTDGITINHTRSSGTNAGQLHLHEGNPA